MDARLRSLLTLTVLCGLLVAAGAWGLNALTQPLPEQPAAKVCTDRTFEPGERVARSDVTVSVLNGGTRNGLAGLTLDLFVDAGFARGEEGNAADAEVAEVVIWSDNPRNPAVRLVRSMLGGDVRVVPREPRAPGVQVVVGDEFTELVAGRRGIKVRAESTVCGPSGNGSGDPELVG